MRAFFAVLSDLIDFATELLRDLLRPRASTTSTSSAHELVGATGIKQQDDIEKRPPVRPLFGQGLAYVVTPEARVFVRPVWAFDTVSATLPLATAVKIDSFEGRFAHIRTETTAGWVLKDDLSAVEAVVWPEYTNGTVYDALHDMTRLTRTLIGDVFFAQELYLPMQPQEFILTRLLKSGRNLPPVGDRPRLVGRWHHIYKGHPGVQIGLEPKTGSVMEVASTAVEPFLAIVTAVHVDGSLAIESIGRYSEGEYRRELLSLQSWRELQPVFIRF